MPRFIDDIGAYLQTNSIGTLATDLFLGVLPDGPDDCVAVIATGGEQPSIYIPTKRPTFQVLVRATSYTDGEDTLAAVRGLLHNLYNTSLNSGQTFAYYIHAASEGGFIGRDDAGRYEFSINFQTLTR